MRTALSRREFFTQAPAGAVAAVVVPQTPPPRAWIIMEANWQFNDEYTYAEGEAARYTLFYDRSAAESECRRLNDEFYARETPDEFQLDWAYYFPGDLPDGKSEADVTWEEVKATGIWSDPFTIRELIVPGANTHESSPCSRRAVRPEVGRHDLRSKSWIPLRGVPPGVHDEALRRAQQLVERTAHHEQHQREAERKAEDTLARFLAAEGYLCEVVWQAAAAIAEEPSR